MEKLLAMHVAAQLTQAACAGVGSSLTVDPELKDNTVRGKNLQVWETFRVFYRAVVAALGDGQNWPPPSIQAGEFLPNLLKRLLPLLSSGPLADLIKKLLSTLPAGNPVGGPVPDPGTGKVAA